jgi:glycerol dehydrogenase-like iron-containing ADH family enzyme
LHQTGEFWHGEKVAFGACAMLALEGRPTPVVEELV